MFIPVIRRCFIYGQKHGDRRWDIRVVKPLFNCQRSIYCRGEYIQVAAMKRNLEEGEERVRQI